jgi:NitT/TauT family transport system substrate-binding protein
MKRTAVAVVALALALVVVIALRPGCRRAKAAAMPAQPAAGRQRLIRVGYFPNITHSQAIVGMANGDFPKALGDDARIEVKIFNAGPSVIEAMFAGEIDLAYIGPNPTINGYVKSSGAALRIVAGATSGGAGLVVRQDAAINDDRDFHGKRVASPQLGNTQDVALRGWLRAKGFVLKEKGGDVQVLPVQNPDQLILFQKKELDAAWTVEPWVSRLIREGGGRLFLDERTLWSKGEFVTAHVIVSAPFLAANRDLVKTWLACHVEVTRWINGNLADAKTLVNRELKRLTGKELPADVIDDAYGRLSITYDPVQGSLLESARSAFDAGFLGTTFPDLSRIYDLSILNEVLREKNLPAIEDGAP